MESSDTPSLDLPSRSLSSLSFCPDGPESNSNKLEQWLNGLSLTDHQQSGERLVNALDELARLDCPPDELFALAEAIRSPSLSTAANSYQRHLQRYITFESSQQGWFDLCKRLYMGLANVYKAVVQCCLDNKEHTNMLAAALHRAISESAAAYLFHCLLYRPAPERLWLELHTLYQLARRHNHQGFQQEDPYAPKSSPMSLENLYKRALMLSRSNTDQLSPSEIQQVWEILSLWINHGKIQPESGIKTYFSARLNCDEGLEYALPEPDKVHPGVIGLNIRVLTTHLAKIKEDPKAAKVLPTELIQHLLSSWGPIQKRSSPRRVASDQCETCFGFTGLHYHLSGKRSFEDIIAIHSDAAGKSNFSEQSDDVWSQAHDAEIRDEDKQSSPSAGEIITFNTEETLDDKYLSALQAKIINSSHTGFCLKINSKLPKQFHAGELIGIRQNNESPWTLYSVRWLGISGQNEVTFGVNLITTSIEPVAISLIHKTQEASHFQRSLMLTDPNEASLIIPSLSGREGAKFELIQNDTLLKGQLMSCINTTPTWSQYQFKLFG
ncbi:hypothetical protein [Endozoicomonas sp. YOMI1]|uniref:hypothetical protein n=1 Tax=Endozoicomonas sp. YOMI1 TaxID=2828739 RepID=UPI0021494CB9|nr:hypothetical protein [Endozoicomonas sp. YOMI1]